MTGARHGSALRIGISCYPTFGGSGIVASEIAATLALRGYSVHVIASAPPSRLELGLPGLRFHRVEPKDYPLLDHGYALALASKMVEVSQTERLDLLHVHYAVPHATSAYLARQILAPHAPRLVTTLHGTDITLVGNDPSFLPITRFSMLQSDRLTAPSQFLADATRRNFELPMQLPIDVIPNFVDTDLYRPPTARSFDVFRTLFAGDPAPVVAHSSNFRAVKRVDDVVRIFSGLHARRPAYLVLIGDGPERTLVEQLVREKGLSPRVSFVGAQRDFVALLQQASLFLMPSESESFGLAALEAQSCGVPVIATRVGGVAEVIVDGETGHLLALGDIGGMVERALALLDDANAWSAMSTAARQRALAVYQRDPMVTRYEACYEQVLAAPPA